MSYVNQLLGENEEVVLVAHQSWVVLLWDALVNLVIALVILALAAIVFGWTQGQPLSLGLALLLLIPLGRFIWQFIRWQNREYIVTNRRVIQVEGTINKNVIDSSLEKVNDVRMSQSVLGRMLNYGDVEILTASDLGSNMFQRIGSPIKFKTAMLNEKEKLGFDEAPAPAPAAPPPSQPLEAPVLLAQLNAMRKEGLITDEEYQKKKADILARM